MKNLFCKLKYNGKNYYGWNLQPNKETIVLNLTKAFQSFYKDQITISGSGRTDRFVHALEQTFTIKLNTKMKAHEIQKILNNQLPSDIEIIFAKFVNLDFHARYSAKNKTYIYKIKTNKKDFLWNQNQFWYIEKQLNISLMKQAAKLLCKSADFTSFAKITKKDQLDTIKTINKIIIVKKDDQIIIKINGSGFLRHMVRKIVATLVEIGQKKIELNFINKALKVKDSSFVAYKAPGKGLYLSKVYYK